jgi:hypothetical protein
MRHAAGLVARLVVYFVIARSTCDEAIQSFPAILDCFASLSSGGRSPDPLARNDAFDRTFCQKTYPRNASFE